MTVSYETMGISTPTVLASPVNFSGLAVCLPWRAFLSPQFGCHYLGDHLSNCLLCYLVHVALDLLQDHFPFFLLLLPLAKLYTHRAEASL